ncbi:MAG: hypothetical protein DMG76_27815 [Acidobacteria bacterium]|nr:MAG: hypothetical protein DMG76_27815 [Acidobacteriota bacterium]
MTEDEKRQQKAMLLLEHQEAEENLAHLEEKAKRVSQRIMAVAEWLERASQRGSDLNRDKIWIPKLGDVNFLADPEFGMAMDFEAAKTLFQEVRDAKDKFGELTKRKQSLGLK